MNKIEVNAGDKYGRLTVVELAGRDKGGGLLYLCKCDCGNEKIVVKGNLVSGRTKSCGCFLKEETSRRRKKTNKVLLNEKDKTAIIYATNTNNEFIIDIEDYEKIKDYTWHETSAGYLMEKSNLKSGRLLHRFIMNAPKGKVVDHINHNIRDNRKSNLRVCSQSDNLLNRKTLPKGIFKAKRGNNTYYLVEMCGKYQGCFSNYDAAVEKREELLKQFYTIKEDKQNGQ